jgi:hypothetical protein
MRAAKTDEPTVFFAVELPIELRSKLRLESARTGRQIRELVADALSDFLPQQITITAHRAKAAKRDA